MKNNKIIILCILILNFTSCSLEEKPIGLVTPATYFENETELDQFTLGAYSFLNSYYAYGLAWYNKSEAYNDQVTPRDNLRPGFIFTSFEPAALASMWQTFYQGIGAANELIRGIQSSSLPDNEKTTYLGEAHFLRGFYYMHLTLAFGGVPLILDDTTIEEAAILPRMEADIVWDKIIEDLIFAANNCPDEFSDSNLKSRATKTVANAILSRVYLYREDWNSAVESANKVVESDKYILMQDFADIWLEDNEQGPEVVFSVEFKYPEMVYNHSKFNSPRKDREGDPWYGFGSNEPTNDPDKGLASMFEENDKRKYITVTDINPYTNEPWRFQNTPSTARRWYFGPKFWDFVNKSTGSSNDFKVMRYAEVLLNLAEAENEANGPANAYEPLNMVRERAGLPLVSNLSQEEFRDVVRHERGVELVNEAHRRWDLIRWGTYYSTIKNMSTVDILQVAIDNYQEYMNLYPIPDSEIAKNPNLVQNPGY